MILDAPACASLLRCSQPHLHRLAREGLIPATKVGRGWVFVEADVVEWLRARARVKVQSAPRKVGRPRNRVLG
jgi:excisionase family DNA binding protein